MYNKLKKNIMEGCNIDEKETKKILRRYDIFGFVSGMIINWFLSTIFKIDSLFIFLFVIVITTIISLILANKNYNNYEKINKTSKIMKYASIIMLCIGVIFGIIQSFFLNK